MPKQIVQDTFEQLTELAKDTGKIAVKEPLNIVKEILGSSGSSQQQTTNPKQDKVQTNDEVQRLERLAKVRRQMQYLKQQAAMQQRLKQEEEAEEEKEEEEDKVKQQQQIVQLQKEEDKTSVLQSHIKAMEGTKESGPRKQF